MLIKMRYFHAGIKYYTYAEVLRDRPGLSLQVHFNLQA